MSSFLDPLFEVKIAGIPVILFFLGFIIIIVYLWKRKPKEEKLKRIETEKLTKNDIKELVNFSSQPVKKPLGNGFYNFAYVHKAKKVFFTKDLNLKDNINVNSLIAKYPEIKDIVFKNKPVVELWILKTSKNNILSKLLAQLGLFIKYLIIDKSLITVNQRFLEVNPLSQANDFYGIVIYSDYAKAWLTEQVIYKNIRENELDEEINFLKKQTHLEVNTSKEANEMDILNEVNRSNKKDRLEQIKKS